MTAIDSVHLRLLEASRGQERQRVAEFVENIRAGVANYFFLNFFAPAGFGKTAALEQIWEEYERVLPASFVRITSFHKEDEGFALCDLLIHIIDALDRRLPRRITSLPDYKQFADKTKLAELIIDLAESARDYETVALLLLDDYDAMPTEDSRWFEARILSELAKTRAVGVILTSELELRFAERIDLRMRLESHELSSLSTETISCSFPQYEGIAPEIHRITGGLPAFTEELIQQLEASHINTDADFRSQGQELVTKYYRTYVKETVLQTIPSDMRETILVLALLRRFDVTVLRGILPKVLPDCYQGYGTVDYLGLIERVGSQVQWRMQGGYALSQALRMMLQGYVLAEEHEFYKQVNRAAAVLYGELLERQYREYYLVELLYHKLALLKSERESDLSSIQTKIGHELLRHLNGDEAVLVRETDLDSLRHSLVGDPDLKDYIAEDILLATPSLIRVHFF